jgi:3-oxoacyl-[acyl-carrier protein] reductase
MAHRAPAGIAERCAWVVGTEPTLGLLATGLRSTGLAVATTSESSKFDIALDRAVAALGRVDTAVWAWTPAGLVEPSRLEAVDASTWRALVGGSLRAYVEFLQAVERRLRDRGGRVVILVPTIALGGAAGMVAWATVADGQRALAKSAARVWGTRGITVNCVAVPTSLLANGIEDLDRPNLQQSALVDPDLEHDVAGVVASLSSDGMSAVTGATLGVDGGKWMPA